MQKAYNPTRARRINMWLDKKLVQALKRYALETDRTMTQVVSDVLRKEIPSKHFTAYRGW